MFVLIQVGFFDVFEERAIAQSPRLSIQAVNNQQVRISWPSTSSGFELESANPLGRPPVWSKLTQTPLEQGASLVVTADASRGERYFRLRAASPALTTIIETSPANGETGVAVSRETMVRFSAPLSPAVVLNTERLSASFGGRKILSRVELSNDRTTATLFYLENLPGSARVAVRLDGDNLSDSAGRMLDADGDGQPGGVKSFDFETLSITPVTGTAVIGRVFASELVPGPGTGTNAINKPLEGVIVTVDGMEQTLRTTTDALGNFKLTNSPAGRFFVHVDGRKAKGSIYPGGAYYPTVGKAWEAAAGRQDNLAGGTGEIYLPLIKAGTLQSVSAIAETKISFPDDVLSENPALQGVEITVPANALFSDNGTRGGKVGIAPVPPDRLPEKLPAGLQFPLVITVQTDGPSNFDVPVPVRFPNLPDPVTGQALPPGAKSALWSFNHDTGRWEIQGPMTVSGDGKFVESDPGVGIRQPGWHGTQPGSPGGGPPGPLPPGQCSLPTLPAAPQSSVALASAGKNDQPGCDCPPPEQVRQQLYACILEVGHNGGACATKTIKCFTCENAQGLNKILKWLCKRGCDDSHGLENDIKDCMTNADGENQRCKQLASCPLTPEEQPPQVESFSNHATDVALSSLAFDPVLSSVSAEVDILLRDLRAAFDLRSQIGKVIGLARTEADLSPAQASQIDTLDAQWSALLGGRTEYEYFIASLQRIDRLASTALEQVGLINSETAFYALEDTSNNLIQRGRTGRGGALDNVILRPDTLYRLTRFFPNTPGIGVVEFQSSSSGKPTYIPRGTLNTDTSGDSDGDGLSALVELVLGTDPAKPDSDGDGIPDGVEASQGTNPLDGRPATLGIVATAPTPGTATDVYTVTDLALVTLGDSGLGVFNIFNGLNPVLIARVDTPGNARAVAADGNLAAIADGTSGLAIVDLSQPASASIVRQVNLGGSAWAVTMAHGMAYVGKRENQLVSVDMQTGVIRETLTFAGSVDDVLVTGNTLWLVLPTELQAYRIDRPALELLGKSPRLSFRAEGITSRHRIIVAEGYAYVAEYPGYDVLDVKNPATIQIIAKPTDRGVANSFKQMVLDGSGYGIGAVGINPRDDGTHDIYLYDTSSPAVSTSFLTVLPTPGLSYAVSLHKGLAYVADGTAGLQVINYRAADKGSNAPAISLAASFPLQPAQAEERRPAYVTASVSDDAAVRSVEFFIDGVRAVEDGSFPFEIRFTTPGRTPAKTSFTLQARATDTGGNSTLTPLLTVSLVPDATPPALLTTTPADGAVLPDVTYGLVARFDEALGVSPTANWFQVIEAGADHRFDTPDDVLIPGTVRLVSPKELALDFGTNPLSNGSYRAILRTAVADQAGNPLASEAKWEFTIADRGAPKIVTTAPLNGNLNVPASVSDVLVTISEPVRAASVSEQSLSLSGGGPDGTVGNPNDRTLVAQKLELLQGGTVLRFVFAQPFVPDAYRAVLSSNVTDLAGNRVTGSLAWDFAVPLRTTLRGRAVFADGSPAANATVRQHNHGVPIGQTGLTGEFFFQQVEFKAYARPDLNVHWFSGNRAFLGRALAIQPVPDGITELGTIVLDEMCAPQIQEDLAGNSVLLQRVSAFAEFNDGTGSALFALGNTSFDPRGAGLFRHDGKDWRRIDGEFEDTSDLVQLVCLAVYDDGRGPALYVGGAFQRVAGVAATNIVRWTGQKWEAVGPGLQAKQPGGPPYRVAAMTVFDDGTGAALYAAGRFDFAGSVPAANIARWNGQNWTVPGGGILGSFPNQPNSPEFVQVLAMTSFNNGGGPALYVGGAFDFIESGGVTINATNIVCWKGGKWSAVGNGVGEGQIKALAVFDDGSGPALFAGGSVNTPMNLARWNGTTWSTVGSGEFLSGVDALVPWEDAQGRALLVAGQYFSDALDPQPLNLARWDGKTWSALGGGADTTTDAAGVQAFGIASTAAGRMLYVGGEVQATDLDGALNSRGVARWDGARWQPAEQAFDGDIRALSEWNDGRGTALYIGGDFTTGGGKRVGGIARWDGQVVEQVGGGLAPRSEDNSLVSVQSLIPFDDGSGSALYVAGKFATRGTQPAKNLARWNGTSWSSVGGAEFTERLGGNPELRTMAVFNDGRGDALFVGGYFEGIRDANGFRFMFHLARWDGSEWTGFPFERNSGIGNGLPGVLSLLPVEKGDAQGLYIAGAISWITVNGFQQVRHDGLAVWDGQSLKSPGDFDANFGVDRSTGRARLFRPVEGLAAVEVPSGTEVFAAVNSAASNFKVGILRMKDGKWTFLPPLPDGFEFPIGDFLPFTSVDYALGFDDGFGPQLYLASHTKSATAGPSGEFEYRPWLLWTGSAWEFLPENSSQRITSNLLPVNHNGIPALLRSSTTTFNSAELIRWTRPATPCP